MLESIDYWKKTGKFTHLFNRNIFYIDTQAIEKPCIVLIHGFPTSSWDWYKLWPSLAERYRLVALDLLGFGFSDKPQTHHYTIMEQADIVEALVMQLNLESFHVLAHDYGDTVAQELLARQNEKKGVGKWLSLCLLNGGLFPETHHARLVQKLLLSPLGGLLTKIMGEDRFMKSFSAVFAPDSKPSSLELTNFWQLIAYNQGNRIFHRLIHYMTDRKLHRSRWVAALHDSIVPLCLINGSADPVSGAHMVHRFRELIGTQHLIYELPTIGHYPQVEAPEDTLRYYDQFLNATAK